MLLSVNSEKASVDGAYVTGMKLGKIKPSQLPHRNDRKHRTLHARQTYGNAFGACASFSHLSIMAINITKTTIVTVSNHSHSSCAYTRQIISGSVPCSYICSLYFQGGNVNWIPYNHLGHQVQLHQLQFRSRRIDS